MKLKIKHVYKSYPKTQHALKDINIDLEQVSCIGIIGESGCGKSTLLRQLAGIENPDDGSILINEVSPILDKKLFQSKIGVVFQQHNLFPHLSIHQNITLILEKIRKQSKEEACLRADEVLKQLFIYDQKDKLPTEISGGQAQRASIARALATHPKLIFLDEPTAALDPVLTGEVLKSVKELKGKGIEFIFVTHEIAFLREFADYIIFMKNGNICEQGSVVCLESPVTQELRDFLEGEKYDKPAQKN
ncbi:MAG: ATP-binding cassette domain-containing protein [Lachnospiraceae bacterium]